jgi:signal transduction histidine kinase
MTNPSRVLKAYAALLAGLGCALFAVVLIRDFESVHFDSVAFWCLSVGVVGGEFVRIKIYRGQEAETVTIGDPFTLSVLFTFGLAPALLVKVIASLLDDIARRQEWWKALFNVGQFSLSLAIGNAVFSALGSPLLDAPSLGVTEILVALTAAVVYFAFNMAAVTTAVSLAVGESPVTAFVSSLKSRIMQQGALLGYTPVVTAAVHHSWALFPLLLIPIVVVYYSASLTQRHVVLAQQLKELYETTRITSGRVGTRESVRQLLERVCNMFNAASASIVFFPGEEEGPTLRTSVNLDDDSYSYMEPVSLDPTQGVWARSAAENRAILVPSPIANPRLRHHYESQGVKDRMVTAIHSDNEVNGVIEVSNRRGDTQTFSNEDLKLFETLANHASIALENARLIDQLEESLEHLTEMNQLKDDFVASVSHELRTPLTSIRGYVGTLLRPDANFGAEEEREFLEIIDRQSNRLHRLIEDLLAVSRLESDSEPTNASLVSIADLTVEVVDELRSKAEEHVLRLDLEGVPLIRTDQGKVHQILGNLIDNAFKYTPEGTTITVTARPEGGGVVVTIADEGPGIDADVQERIFDRFYQVDQSSTRAVGGAGLGLYICRRTAEAIGGRVWLERSDEHGSIFSLWLPSQIPTRAVVPSSAAKLGDTP